MRKAAPKETPKPCNKPKMPPGGHRKPPWTEAVAVRRDRLAAGRVAHETKEFLKVLDAMAETLVVLDDNLRFTKSLTFDNTLEDNGTFMEGNIVRSVGGKSLTNKNNIVFLCQVYLTT